ncbi:MAG TPA: response regulator [Chloroflexota bacterium]|nr:response regulator [Chloroflexota bacterium]
MDAARSVVLVVEDDVPTVDLLRRLLSKADYAVESAPTGAAGLARIARGGVDVVLLDLRLPDLDGIELCRRVREQPGGAHLPIIMLTGDRGDQQRRAGFAAGANDYVTKPFHLDELLDRVRVWAQMQQYLKDVCDRPRELALREQLVRDEAILAMTQTAVHEWARLSAALLDVLRLWEQHVYSPMGLARLRSELQDTAADLAARLVALQEDLAREQAPRRN